jgi:aminopeptidase
MWVVKASAAKGDELLQQLLKIEGAERLGETAIGTNYGITRFTKNMLFDEKMGGTIHMALGLNPASETGGLNKSALHWDILKDMKRGEIYADGEPFYKKGSSYKSPGARQIQLHGPAFSRRAGRSAASPRKSGVKAKILK